MTKALVCNHESVPILKFLCTFDVGVECAAAKAIDRCEDVIGRFGPVERRGRCVSDFDIGGDRGLQFSDGFGSQQSGRMAC